jgi:peroxiredoxin
MKNIWIIILGLVLCGCIKEKAGRDLEVGDRLPDFEVVMNDGTTVSDDILKGNISVVMFFHSTCPDCQSALPRVQQLYDEYVSKGVLFALISREQPAEEIEAYWRAIGLNLPYSAQNSRIVYELFAKTRIPRIYINDKDGIIRHIFTDDPVPAFNELKESLESVIR